MTTFEDLADRAVNLRSEGPELFEQAMELAAEATQLARDEMPEALGGMSDAQKEKHKKIVKRLARVALAIGGRLRKASGSMQASEVTITVNTVPPGIAVSVTWRKV